MGSSGGAPLPFLTTSLNPALWQLRCLLGLGGAVYDFIVSWCFFAKESTVPVVVASRNNVCPSQLIQFTDLYLNFQPSVRVCLSGYELGYQKLRYQGDHLCQGTATQLKGSSFFYSVKIVLTVDVKALFLQGKINIGRTKELGSSTTVPAIRIIYTSVRTNSHVQ